MLEKIDVNFPHEEGFSVPLKAKNEVSVPVILPANWKENGDRRNPSSAMQLASALGKAIKIQREGKSREATVIILSTRELTDDLRDKIASLVKIRDMKPVDAKA